MASQRDLLLKTSGVIGYAEEMARLLRQMIALEQELAARESPAGSNGNGHARTEPGPNDGALRSSIAEIKVKLDELLE